MDVKANFESLTFELEALRNRVRNFITEAHWQTDGEWKESVLRSVLKGNLPAHIEPLRGFVVTPESATGQIDLLLYDNRKPVLFRDGDLVFLTPDAVLGIVEVKSRIHDRHGLRKALDSLSADADLIRSASKFSKALFVGLFSYQTDLSNSAYDTVLKELQDIARGRRERIVSNVCLGCANFCMFWQQTPDSSDPTPYDTWHSYGLPNLAAGYFISNLVASVSGDSVENNLAAWFPGISKELQLLGSRAFLPGMSPKRRRAAAQPPHHSATRRTGSGA